MTKLSENIKKFRLKSGITQEDLSRLLGKTKNVISNWERGDNRPDADTIEVLCKILGVTPNELYGWNKDESITVAAHLNGSDDLSDDELEDINRYIEFVKSRRK